MYIVHYKIQGEDYSIRFMDKTSAQLFAKRYNGKLEEN
jgi:hypothetical protein